MSIIKNEEEESGQGGKTGAVEFQYRDILSAGPRDDQLPAEEMDDLLKKHEKIHKEYVDTQKETRKERDAIKQGRTPAAHSYDGLGLGRGGAGGGGASPYKSHPISQHAQFSGATDRKVTGVPSDNLAQTNEEEKQELEDKLQLRLRHRNEHKNVPKFNPTPRPF
ncbi:MAG: hypothetical protein K0S27_1074 [Gammaproteobacteria bacterium]|jgi:hypothetical protein|nr:hypothetical protein [Gammaproteobacteria bacterium]